MRVIVTTMSGDRFLGETPNDVEGMDAAMELGQPVILNDVYSIVQMNMQVAPGFVSRSTKLANPDFYSGAMPENSCLISSWYTPSDEVLPHIEKEIKEVEERRENAENGVDPMEELMKKAREDSTSISQPGPVSPSVMRKLRGP